jgi:hypothetical protein
VVVVDVSVIAPELFVVNFGIHIRADNSRFMCNRDPWFRLYGWVGFSDPMDSCLVLWSIVFSNISWFIMQRSFYFLVEFHACSIYLRAYTSMNQGQLPIC